MSKNSPKNILLIVTDQWRSDCFGVAGHPVVQTPHLDLVAESGTRFTRAYSSVPTCIAARAALMTGLDQRRHGRVGYKDRVEWTYPTTIASHLADMGYHTQAVGKMHVHPSRWLGGFHNVRLHDGYLEANRVRVPELNTADDYMLFLKQNLGAQADYIDSGPGCNGYSVAPWPYEPMLHPTAWVATESVEFLTRRDPTKPFFLMSSFHRPHPPLDPPESFLNLYRDVELPPLVHGDWNDRPGVPHNARTASIKLHSPRKLSDVGVDLARRAYYAQIHFIDTQINRIIHALYEHRLVEDTSIIFVSDHGEQLYDHGQVSKAQPFESSAGVPLFVRPAPSLGMPAQQVCDDVVELRDIFPTVCDLGGVPAPAGLDGLSLAPQCRGERPVRWRDYLHGEHAVGEHSNQWIVQGPWKYIWYSQTGTELLFDIETDPCETRDLSAAQPDRTGALRALLVEALTGREEGYVSDGQLITARPPQEILAEAGLA